MIGPTTDNCVRCMQPTRRSLVSAFNKDHVVLVCDNCADSHDNNVRRIFRNMYPNCLPPHVVSIGSEPLRVRRSNGEVQAGWHVLSTSEWKRTSSRYQAYHMMSNEKIVVCVTRNHMFKTIPFEQLAVLNPVLKSAVYLCDADRELAESSKAKWRNAFRAHTYPLYNGRMEAENA